MFKSTRARLVAGIGALAVAAAAAGGWWYATQGSRGAPGTPLMAGADKNTPFAALECGSRMFDDSPALAVQFSQPLDRKQNLNDLLRVTDLGSVGDKPEKTVETAVAPSQAPKSASGASGSSSTTPTGPIVQGAWVVGDNARIAYFPNIQPQRKYRINVPTETLSVDGQKLTAAKACDVSSEAMGTSFYFASRGVVLPAGQNGGLPIVTVNAPEVDVQFLKVNDGDLARFFQRVAGSRATSSRDENSEDMEYHGYRGDENRSLQGRVMGWDLDQISKSARSVYLGRFTTGELANKRRVTYLPVEGINELKEPGVYVAVMGQPGRFREDYQVTYFYVSDIGLGSHRHTNGSLDAFATSLRSGKAIGGVEFELLDENARSLGKTKADGDGHGAFASVPPGAVLLVARNGKEMTTVVLTEPGLDLSEFDVGGHLPRNTKLFAYAGRDLYRPGESFDLSVLARDADGRMLPPAPIQAVLKRPDGRTVQTSTWRPHEKIPGYLRQRVALPADAQTGAWTLELRADPGAHDADAVWAFKVEEFLPERMKLDLTTAKPLLTLGDDFTVQVRGDYLFGSPAAGNRLLASVATERLRQALPAQWPGFIFGDFADDSLKKNQQVSDDSLDEQGHAEVELPVDASGINSPLLVRGSFSLLESGGRPVVRSIERAVWPAPQLLAVRPLFDRDVAPDNNQARFELIRVGADGKLAPLANAQVKLVREDRQYYWRFDDQKGWHSGYTEAEEVIESGAVAINARTPLALPVGYGRYRLEVKDPSTGLSLRYRFYAGWGAQDLDDIGNRPDRVQLKLAKAPLKAGEKAALTITPPHDGTAIVTVQGDKLLWSQRVDVSTSGTTVNIPIADTWTRHDLYIAVTAFRPGSQGDRVTPARAVGLVHLPLAREDRKLKVALTAPAKVRPETRVVVKVKAEGLEGKAAIVTLSAVDVGILNITRFKTPDPFDFFFGKHRFASELQDMYGKLIEKMEGGTAKLKWGGDTKRSDSKSLPKKVKLVDLFSGPVALNAKGEAEIALNIPDFNGTLRLMAVVSSPDRFGSTDTEMVSAAPVVAELAMPRFISPGDSAALALDVTNLSGSAQTLRIQLEGADPLRVRDGERSLSLKDKQRVTLRFPVEATDAYGLGRLRLQVSNSGSNNSSGGNAIKIERESWLQVQPPVPQERDVRRARIEPGASLKLDAAWVEKYFKGSATFSVSLSNKPPLNVNRLVQGLLDYPYGCLEQTTSAAYPHLFIDEAAAKAYGLATRSRDERAQFIEGAIGRLAGMQKANGGFTLWGNGPYETWLSAYVIGFLQDARQQGFGVPDTMYKQGQDWLLTQLQTAPNLFPTLPATAKPASAPDSSLVRYDSRDYTLLRDSHQRFAEMAHVGYILARDQKAPLSLLRLLHDKYRDRARSPLPLVHLSIALKLMGDEARAKVALNDAMQRPYGITTHGHGGYEWLGDYGSSPRDLAMSYALLARHTIAHPRRENLLFDLANRVGSRQYYSTQERLSLFLAARAAGGDASQAWTALVKTGPTTQALESKTTAQQGFTATALAQGASIVNTGSAALFAEVEVAGYPTKAPAPRADVIALKRDWFQLDGSPWRGGPLSVGDMLIVRLRATSRQAIEDALIVDRIPAGFEVENLNLSDGPDAGQFSVDGVNVAQAMADSRIKHREYRDDRYVAAARLDGGELRVFYLVRVVSPGRFVVPPAFAEDMYRPELRGVGVTDAPITIRDPRQPGAAAEVVAASVAASASTAASAVPAPATAASAPPRPASGGR